MKYLLFTLFLFIVIAINAQTELSSSFNSTHSGRNVTFAFSKTYNARHELGGGIRFNINKPEMSDDQNKVYMNISKGLKDSTTTMFSETGRI
ncbi:hypothetical protein SAMN05444274_10634 [Mariniphaga anaerophila]|uniref:Outer membrane protein beta-barrel family protein n=1 Tax=Mariniphaga anaerophila TaxID=1484053 RepID=A0A1M5CAX3_9BACT|nr:hypothetical protein [Mariniphaga anaerophila]SHF51914.1 hypothetical protein SAMN05444274_10634 [Mariniphaga anaerophila]